jgi:acetyl esterase/lipase
MSNNALHPTVLNLLDPEYIDFHNEYLLNCTSPHHSLWDPSTRLQESPIALANLPAVDVESTRDIPLEDKRFFLRVYFPTAKQPDKKWPALVWFHGGMYSTADS